MDILKRLLIVMVLFGTVLFGDVIHFHGYVPSGLDPKNIEMQFLKIQNILDSTSSLKTVAPVQIIFYRKSEQQMHGIRLPEWGGGGAIGKDTVVIPLDGVSAFYENNMERVIVHELVHIAIARMYGNVRVPRWFHEGLAMTLSGEVSFDEQVLLARAIVTRSLIPLDSIEYVNRFSHYKASLAYSQCHAVVTFLIETYGTDLIPELLGAARKTRYFENACIEIFGMTIKEIEFQFIKKIQKKYPLLMLTSDTSLFWLLVLFLSFVAFGVTMWRRQKRKAVMVIEELAEDMELLKVDNSNESLPHNQGDTNDRNN